MNAITLDPIGLRTNHPLDDEQLFRAAPSIFATAPRGDKSDRYAFLSTANVVAGMREAGFLPFFARQSVARDVGGAMFARHEVRFRHVDTLDRLRRVHTPGIHNFLDGHNAEEYDEIALINSHDGSTPFELVRGVFRVRCTNGLVVASGMADSVRIRHAGSIVDNVIEGATRILEDTERVIGLREGMKAITLERDEQLAFAEAALQLRYGEEAPITPDALVTARRKEDTDPTLWNVFNVVQENMIKGGVRGHTVNTGRRMTTRGITGITQDLAVNRMLWSLAEAARNMRETLNIEGLTAADVLEGGELLEA